MEENQKTVTTTGEKVKKGGHIILIIFAILCAVGLGYLVFKKLTANKKVDLQAIPSVNVTHIRKGSVNKDISVMGNILPNDTYYVVAKVGGDLNKIYVKNGDHVKKGDPICDIDASKEIEAAYITYDTAKKSFERMQKLYQAGDISQQSFESVKAQYDAAKLAYDTKVEYATPVAVADGVVENTDMIENTSIKTEKVLCYITSKEGKEINFGVTERVLDGIKIGDKVTIEKNGKEYDGYISNVANLIDTSTGLFKVKAVITSENNFASGIMAKVTFTYDRRKNVQTLPNELVYYEAGNAYIFTVGNDNVVTKKYIEVGIENEKTTEIVTPLDRSLKIVSTWNNDLAEGATVKIINDEKVEDEVYIESEVSRILETSKYKEKEEIATTSELDENDCAIEINVVNETEEVIVATVAEAEK